VPRETTVVAAAQLMRKRHVGDVVVVHTVRGKTAPAGIITDRDIVISVVAPHLDPGVFTVGDMLLRPAITCRETDDVASCLENMRANAIRRMPVVNKKGELVGIISIDDLIRFLSGELSAVAKLITREQAVERRTRK
jgi:CBS domain-containing protein